MLGGLPGLPIGIWMEVWFRLLVHVCRWASACREIDREVFAPFGFGTRDLVVIIRNDNCKTSIAKAQLQNNNCITTIAKQQVLKQIFETLRGTPPGKRKIEHSKTVRKCKKREVRGTPPPACTTVFLQKLLRTPIGSASYTYHWGKTRSENSNRDRFADPPPSIQRYCSKSH